MRLIKNSFRNLSFRNQLKVLLIVSCVFSTLLAIFGTLMILPVLFESEPASIFSALTNIAEYRSFIYLLILVTLLAMTFSSLVGILISYRLMSVIFQPITNLTAAVNSAHEENNYDVRAETQKRDELGQLIINFNTMLDRFKQINQELKQSNEDLKQKVTQHRDAEKQLKATHNQLLETSRLAGMAEVATGMLHNVGNTLTSVNVSATVISEKLQNSDIKHFYKLNALFQENADDLINFFQTSPKASKIAGFMSNLEQVLKKEHQLYQEEIECLRKNVNHIRDIIETQQSFSKVVGFKEIVNPTDLMDNALFLNDGDILKYNVQVNKDYDFTERIMVERHKVLQILVNLVRNAIQATKSNKEYEREIVVYVHAHGDDCVQFQVNDNGMGISSDNLKRIFQHGFTTKDSGHGFGLHSSALFAKEMGGSLSAYSDGVDQGASFVLTIPANFEAVASTNHDHSAVGASN